MESSCGPAVSFSNNSGVTNGPILLVYKAANSTALNMASFDLAGGWLSDVPIQSRDGSIRPPTSDQTPAVTGFRDFLFLVFKAAGTNDLNVAQMDLEGNWHWNINIATLSGGAISPKTTLGPSIITFNNTLFIIYRSENSNDLRVTKFDGKLWTDATIASQPGGITPESTCAPGLAVFNNRLFLSYKSPQNNDLNIASFDGTIWSGNSQIFNHPAVSDPNPIVARLQLSVSRGKPNGSGRAETLNRPRQKPD